MKDLGITQEKLSEHLEITPGAISHWLNARRSPDLEEIAKILHFLKLDEFIVDKNGFISSPANGDHLTKDVKEVHCYPLVNKDFLINNFNSLTERTTQNIAAQWLESEALILGTGFWYKVEGDSMLSTSGLSVPGDSLVLFDTGRTPSHNDLVLTRNADGKELSFKCLQKDGDKHLLVPLNPRWPVSTVENLANVLGVAIEAKQKFK